jgi:hypothetical protein
VCVFLCCGNSRKNISHNACYLKISYTKQHNEYKGEKKEEITVHTQKFSRAAKHTHAHCGVSGEKLSAKKNFLLCAEKINTEIFSVGKNSADISQLDFDSNRWAFFFEKFSTSFTQKRR